MAEPRPLDTVRTSGPNAGPEANARVLTLRGVRVHNLQNIDLDLPLGQLIVLTGLSGSGKSSLADGTLFVEGQRRYLSGLLPRSRRLTDLLPRPEADRIRGLPPTVRLEQHHRRISKRTRLADITELADFLRLLYARAGQPHCPSCGRAISHQTPRQIVDRIRSLPERTKVMLLAPVSGTGPDLSTKLDRLVQDGFLRVRIDGELHELPELDRSTLANRQPTPRIENVIDRIIVKPGIEGRLTESVHLTVREGDDLCRIAWSSGDGWIEETLTTRLACTTCETTYPVPQPKHLNPASPQGACSRCAGLGQVLPEDDASKEAEPSPIRCADCDGTGLGDVARAITLGGRTYPDLLSQPVTELLPFIHGLQDSLDTDSEAERQGERETVLERVLPQVASRLQFLERIGLGYLTLDRSGGTLSGGEYQRARLATCLGAGLTGVCYLLDEPTIGLHPSDMHRLLDCLRELKQQDNTVIVVEHDPLLWRAADLIVDLGPHGGERGGHVVAIGRPMELATEPERFPESLTARYLSTVPPDAAPEPESPFPPERMLKLTGVRHHNLEGVDIALPTGALIGVAGVSGSGKSSLFRGVLLPLLRAELDRSASKASPRGHLDRIGNITAVRLVDQLPIGRNGRSNPATFLGLWDDVRKLMAKTREAKLRGFTPRRFSFNAAGGRCEACEGTGTWSAVDLAMTDIEPVCPYCGGARFNRATLAVRFRGRSVADLLAMRVSEAAEFFENLAPLRSPLDVLRDLGLGYLTLGQPAPSLSGGEAQRLKLAKALANPSLSPTLFLLDEPTSGLHPTDVGHLQTVLRRLVDQGHTVVVIEHQTDILMNCDWLIELGPGAGADGGRVLHSGSVESLLPKQTATAEALRMLLEV